MSEAQAAPMQQQVAMIAPGVDNVLAAAPPRLTFVLLWPSFRNPVEGQAQDQIGDTGVVTHHYHYRRGVLNVSTTPVNWTTPEQITPASYTYDRSYAGMPLPNVDVDLFRADGTIDFADYTAVMRPFYTVAPADQDPSSPPEEDTGAVPCSGSNDALASAYLLSAVTDAEGCFSFSNLAPGDYVIHLRGRLSFVANASPGATLAQRRGHHWVCLKLHVTDEGDVELFAIASENGTVTETPLSAERLLEPGQSSTDSTADTPYRLYALPLVLVGNTAQWDACVEVLRRAFTVTAAQARTAMETTPVLDLAALLRWECATWRDGTPPPAVIAEGATMKALLTRTLVVGRAGQTDVRTMAYDHAMFHFANARATSKTLALRLPLGDAGFFSAENHLYRLATKTKGSYGRYALRFVEPNLDGRDIRELKIRLILWGTNQRWVDVRNDGFDQALREALLRFKRDRELFRVRVNLANGTPDPARCVIVTVVDDETYRALDEVVPSFTLDDVADDDGIPPTQGAAANEAQGTPLLLTEEGYSRVLFYAAQIALRRICPDRAISVHSSFRTLAHNRHVYLNKFDQQGIRKLRWRLASTAPEAQFEHAGFVTTVGGVMGNDGTNHVANAAATPNSVRYHEPRGTYVSGVAGDNWAPDYSRHTTGRAIDFCFNRGHPQHDQQQAQIQRDTNAIVLLGASRNNHVAGRIWLEPGNPPVSWGTTTWIHMDSGDLPMDREEFVLTEHDVQGPRWDATLIVSGRVTRGENARLGARVALLDQGEEIAHTYADRNGDYLLWVRDREARAAGYSIQARFEVQYAYQPPVEDPPASVECEAVALPVAHPGEECRDIALVLPV
jgi:hypothetical protein